MERLSTHWMETRVHLGSGGSSNRNPFGNEGTNEDCTIVLFVLDCILADSSGWVIPWLIVRRDEFEVTDERDGPGTEIPLL